MDPASTIRFTINAYRIAHKMGQWTSHHERLTAKAITFNRKLIATLERILHRCGIDRVTAARAAASYMNYLDWRPFRPLIRTTFGLRAEELLALSRWVVPGFIAFQKKLSKYDPVERPKAADGDDFGVQPPSAVHTGTKLWRSFRGSSQLDTLDKEIIQLQSGLAAMRAVLKSTLPAPRPRKAPIPPPPPPDGSESDESDSESDGSDSGSSAGSD
ncbi:hypothetical protein FN846DRAFT_906035 [Sphaerosporella brunnea]|uniref:Uncharacterized protein n=1 Tax=Sphaerosporella brunnea TaxID=1250544 RepID=A0A5J5F020_9PEZI|nr:hypothetical protein FN846DRAFT_906035 [Sphaerosporella brunnea]